MGKGRAAGRVGSGQTFCRQSRVGSTFRRVGSGPRKVTRGQLCNACTKQSTRLHRSFYEFSDICCPVHLLYTSNTSKICNFE